MFWSPRPSLGHQGGLCLLLVTQGSADSALVTCGGLKEIIKWETKGGGSGGRGTERCGGQKEAGVVGEARAGSRGRQRPDQGKVRDRDFLSHGRVSLGEEEARSAPG